ncbi:hypothetical protein OUZ56_011605 [Daphnia magna]|uniref:Uncharacterized protein n=1 Tax=Daphnia magna TaxID=35525 RepID=A0ABQ9Z0L2_9CRUS|nr:hypothetical protein OUZ56_011605 [Daphnia magna]
MANSENRHPEDGSTGCVVLGKTGGCRDRYRGGSVRGDSTGRSCKAVSIRWEDDHRGGGFGSGRRHRLTSGKGHVGKTWNADEDWGATGDLHWRHCHRSTGGRDDGGSTETSSPERMLGPTPIDESGRNSTTRFERVWRMCTGGTIPSIAEDENGVDGKGPGRGTIGQMAITNLSDHQQWIEEGTVLGIIEPVTEIKEGDLPVAVATAGAEKKGFREHEFESRIGEGVTPTDREKIQEVLVEYGDCFSWPGDQLGLCTAAEHTIDTGKQNQFDNHPMLGHGRRESL